MEISFDTNFNRKILTKREVSFSALQRTCSMLKPDAFERELTECAESGLKGLGLKIVKEWTGVPDRKVIEEHCCKKKGRDFFDDLVNFLTSGNVKIFLIEGEDAVVKVRQFVEEFRAKYAPGERRKNLMHASDSSLEAEREISNFFKT